MYTFKKTSWHVRFYKWLFDKDPTTIYKSMCPYFWTYVLIFISLPLILLIKLLGKKGNQFLNWLEEYKREKRNKMIEEFRIRASKEDMSEEEAFQIVRSKCWEKYRWWLDWETESIIKNLSKKHSNKLHHLKVEELNKRQEKIKEFKENKYLTFTFNAIGIAMMLLILASLVYFISQIHFNWKLIGKYTLYGLLIVVAIIVVIGIIYSIIKLVHYLSMKISCINFKCPLCMYIPMFFSYIGRGISTSFPFVALPFVFMFKGVALVCNMLYNTYKRNCPIIKWEE